MKQYIELSIEERMSDNDVRIGSMDESFQFKRKPLAKIFSMSFGRKSYLEV